MKITTKIKNFLTLRRIGILLLIVFSVVLVGISVKSCVDAKKQRDAIHQELVEMKRLTDQVVLSRSEYVSKDDLDQFGKNLGLNLSEIKQDLAAKDAKMVAISRVLAISLGRQRTNVPSSWTQPGNSSTAPSVECPDGSKQLCEDSYGYWSNSQGLDINENFPNVEVPIGTVTFEAWQEDPWSYEIYPREYHVTTVLGTNKQGRHYTYNKFEIDVDGERHPIEVKDSVIKEILPEADFNWWNPRFGIGFHGGVGFNTAPSPDGDLASGVFGPTVSFSPFSYGQLDVKPEWVFARVGIGVDAIHRTAAFSLAPAMWNIGSEVDFIQNTYLGPVITVDHQGRVGGGLGVTTDF